MKLLIQPFYNGETGIFFAYFHNLKDVKYKISIYNTIYLSIKCKFIILHNKNSKPIRVQESLILAVLHLK